MFYNGPGRYSKIRAFSGSAWKTHVPDLTMGIAEIRNCSELRPEVRVKNGPKAEFALSPIHPQ
jgi:hypothetical protein